MTAPQATELPGLIDTYQLYIDGRWVEPENGRYEDISPATEHVIATAPDASINQVGAAIGAARRAFDEGPWADMTAADRANCLSQLGDALLKHADEFFALSQLEWGCIANERVMQVDGAAFMSMHAAQLATQLADEEVTGIGAGTTLLRHAPLGVVSVLTPWNFPHCLNVMKLNHALAAGNTVVLKPSPLTPLAGLALARIIDENTDFPPGVVNVVTPSGVDAAKLLTTDPRIDMVSFTGSTVVGRQVMSAAGDTLKRLLLELGGKSACIILDDAQITDEMLQQMLFDCCSLHAGQACILHSRLLLPDSLHDDVVDRLAALRVADQRAHLHVGIRRIPDLDRPGQRGEPVDHVVVQGVRQQQPAVQDAGL
ncbi:aldehyde dehydrogenase family protein, partial [Mycobacterium asiaticum]|uniref:aldehyde dehydrogenase family protein n=1 Tax=Mycobacterium asiaticum TaxID=1790 RepID=UPI003F51049E